jgi:hypothetical protein
MSTQVPARAREPALIAIAFSAVAAPVVALALLVGVGQPVRDVSWLPAVAFVALGALPVVLGLIAVVRGRPLALLVAGALSVVLALPLSNVSALLLALLVPAALYGVAYLRWEPRPTLGLADALRLALPVLLGAAALVALAFVPQGEPDPVDLFRDIGSSDAQPFPQDFFSSITAACEGIPRCGREATPTQVGIGGALILLSAAAGLLLPGARAAEAAGPAPAVTASDDQQPPPDPDG